MEKINSLVMPSDKKAEKVANRAVENNNMLVILGSCLLDYDGRAVTNGYLPEGDRLIFLKKDGTMHVHSTEKKQPIRWQNSGAKCNIERKDDEVIVETKGHNKGTEDVVTVFFKEIYQITSYDAVDKKVSSSADSLMGTEKDMKKFIIENPDSIENGFRFIEEEYKTEEGPVDIFGKDPNGNPVILELKARHAQRSHVRQLNAYVEEYKNKNPNVRGILVAPSLSDGAKKKMEKSKLEFVKLHPQEGIEDMKTEKTELSEF